MIGGENSVVDAQFDAYKALIAAAGLNFENALTGNPEMNVNSQGSAGSQGSQGESDMNRVNQILAFEKYMGDNGIAYARMPEFQTFMDTYPA
jgi:hypothetical protein